MELHTYLLQLKEPCPKWLVDFHPEDSFDRDQFFNSRIVYYPGSGNDGHAVKCFGSTHAAHCFVYVDSMTEQSRIEAELSHSSPQNSHRFLGYHCLARLSLDAVDLIPNGWKQHADTREERTFREPHITPYGFLEVLERDADRDDTHGAERLAILFLGADGIASYDALFCQKDGTPPPFAVLIQDHGFGGNYDKFGGDGLLEGIADQCKVFPKFLLVAKNSKPWVGYSQSVNVNGEAGGMHRDMRFLHQFIR